MRRDRVPARPDIIAHPDVREMSGVHFDPEHQLVVIQWRDGDTGLIHDLPVPAREAMKLLAWLAAIWDRTGGEGGHLDQVGPRRKH